MQSNKEKEVEMEKNNSDNNINNAELRERLNKIEDKFKYFDDMKENYDKFFMHEYLENIGLVENNQDLMEKKIDYFKSNQELYNIKKPEMDLKLLYKRRMKNYLIEELLNVNNDELKDCYFNLDPKAFEYGTNNKNILYKDEGLQNIYNIDN